MQGSGTFSVEAVIGMAAPADGKLLVLVNGAYGERMVQIADRLRIPWRPSIKGRHDHRMWTCFARHWRPIQASPMSPRSTARRPPAC